MSTAVPTPVTPPPAAPISARTKLVLASVFGAAVVLGGLFVAGYFVPTYWDLYVAPMLGKGGAFVNVALRLLAQLAAAGVIIWVGTRSAGSHPPKGLRGGIGLIISVVFALFFLVRALGLNLEGYSSGGMITGGVALVMVFFTVRFLLSDRANRYMIDLEHAGWFHTNAYKPTQGVALRRYTLVGVLLLGGSGIYTLSSQNAVPYGTLALRIPFTGEPHYLLPLLPAAETSLILLLSAALLWFGWRLINVPAFADFLINTEAEMNKVSWSSKKQLAKDTLVVLVTVVILTLFLLVIDLFWGWLLSRSIVGVLPSSQKTAAADAQAQSDTPAW